MTVFTEYVLHNLVTFVQFKNVKNSHERVLILVKLHVFSPQLYYM